MRSEMFVQPGVAALLEQVDVEIAENMRMGHMAHLLLSKDRKNGPALARTDTP